MIKHVRIRNFKAWKSADVDFGRVTGLFGTNSSGKSSLIQFLLMLKQTKNAIDRGVVLDFGSVNQLVNLGSYKEVVNFHKADEKISWSIKWSLDSESSIYDTAQNPKSTLATASDLKIETSVSNHTNRLVCDTLKYSFGGYEFGISPKLVNKTKTEFQLGAKPPEGGHKFKLVRYKARAWALPGPVKTHLFPDQAKTYYQNTEFLSFFEAKYEALMDSIFYLGPLREYPKREYHWSGTRLGDLGMKGENAIGAILAATAAGELRNLKYKSHLKPFQEIIAHWLKDLGLIHSFKIEPIGTESNLYKALVKRDADSPPALLTDVGFGVSQVLPALVLLYYVPKGSTVIMEQPEIHLHPKVQSGLADVIMAASETRNLQVIVESHSEHMLRRFQRRIAEKKYDAKDIKLYFCDYVQGQSKLIDLDVDMFGQIKNWPSEFFGNEMEEIAETRKAIIKRQMAEKK